MPDFPISPISLDGYLQSLSASAIRDLMSGAESGTESEGKFTQFLPGNFVPVTPAGSSAASSGASGVPSKDVDPDASGNTVPYGRTAVLPRNAGSDSRTAQAFSFVDRYVPGDEVPVSTWMPYSPAQNPTTQHATQGTAAAVLQAYASAQGTPPVLTKAALQSAAAPAEAESNSDAPATDPTADPVENAAASAEHIASTVENTAAGTAETASAASASSPLEIQAESNTAPVLRGTINGREVVSQAVPTDWETFSAPLKELLSPLVDLRNVAILGAARGDSVPLLEFDTAHTQQILGRLLTTSLGLSAGGEQINLIVDTRTLEDAAVRLQFVIQAQGMELSSAALSYLNENGALPVGPPLENLALNLMLCRQLAVLMKGNLAVRSDEECGTLFYLDLPARRGKAHGKVGSGEIGRFSGRRVLLAMEDSALSRQILDLLRKREMFPDAAGSAADAVRRFEESHSGFYDAIIALQDAETIRRLRSVKQPDAAKIPILTLLPDPSSAKISAAFDSGCSVCLPLPISAPDLFNALGLLML